MKKTLSCWIVFGVILLLIPVQKTQAEKVCNQDLQFCVVDLCQVPFGGTEKAVKNAYMFFQKLGYEGKYPVTIVYQPEVLVNWSYGSVRILGKYEENEKTVYLTCPKDPWIEGRNDFNIPMNDNFYATIVTHEVVHFLTNRFAGRKVEKIMSEYISYSAQISLFESSTKDLLRQQYGTVTPFDVDDIDPSIMMLDPGIFGYKAYLSFRKNGGALIHKIIKEQFVSASAKWDFPPY